MTATESANALASWNDAPARRAIVDFVERVCGADGSTPVPVEERIAVFDNDGTGNSNGDIPMLEFAQQREHPFLRLLVLHDDSEREFAYTQGAEHALEQATSDGWTVVSVTSDWATVFDRTH